MCDYSLEYLQSRPFEAHEALNLTRFETGSKGFSSPKEPGTPVCVMPGTQMLVGPIPLIEQRRFGLSEYDLATFFTYRPNELGTHTYRDGITFSNGVKQLLQQLPEGLPAVPAPTAEQIAGAGFMSLGFTVTVAQPDLVPVS
jgi:hypothetical protein